MSRDVNHDRFLKHLDKSQEAVWRVAGWLNDKKKLPVQVNPGGRAPLSSEHESYADNGDLTVGMRVEVKRLSRSFTGRDDWPFKDFMVCARHSWDKAVQKPYAYVIVNKEGTHAALVKGETYPSWDVIERSDRRYEHGYSQEFYLCPLELVKWEKMG